MPEMLMPPNPCWSCTKQSTHVLDEDKSQTELDKIWQDNQVLRSEIAHYNVMVCGAQSSLSPSSLKDDPEMLKFYRGIPDWTVFMALYNLVCHAIPTTFMNESTEVQNARCVKRLLC